MNNNECLQETFHRVNSESLSNGIIILYRERTCSKMIFQSKNVWKIKCPLSFNFKHVWKHWFPTFRSRANNRAKYYFILRGHFSLSHLSRICSKRISTLSARKKTTLLISIHRYFNFFVSIFYFFPLEERKRQLMEWKNYDKMIENDLLKD